MVASNSAAMNRIIFPGRAGHALRLMVTPAPLSDFTTNRRGSAVTTIGAIRQIVQNGADEQPDLTILPSSACASGAAARALVP